VSGIGVRMMELEVDINFTSLYKVNETFFRGIVVGTLVANISTNYLKIEESFFQREKVLIFYGLFSSTTKSSYFLFTEP
jgi:hypothetical protein